MESNPIQAEKIRKEKDRLEGERNKVRARLCANAVVTITPPNLADDDINIVPGKVVAAPDHCRKPRRNGSKYCQDCSDKHNGRV